MIKNILLAGVGFFGTARMSLETSIKNDNKIESNSKDLVIKALKNVPVPSIAKFETVQPTSYDSIFYFEKGKIEGLKLCPKYKEKPFRKPSIIVKTNGHMVLDRSRNVYKIPIKNCNPDSVNMLNDSVEEPINIIKGDIKMKPLK